MYRTYADIKCILEWKDLCGIKLNANLDMQRRDLLKKGGIGLLVGSSGIGVANAKGTPNDIGIQKKANNKPINYKGGCDFEVIQATSEKTLLKENREPDGKFIIADHVEGVVSIGEVAEINPEVMNEISRHERSISELNAKSVDLIRYSETWGGKIGRHLGTTQYEAGVAFTTGKDLGNYTASAVGGAICSLIPGIGILLNALAGAACSLLGSIVIDVNSGGNKTTFGMWDSTGFLGAPLVKFGGASGHVYSHEDCRSFDSFPGMIDWYINVPPIYQ